MREGVASEIVRRFDVRQLVVVENLFQGVSRAPSGQSVSLAK